MSVAGVGVDKTDMTARWLLGLHICAAAAFVHLLSERCAKGGTASQAFAVAAAVPALALPVWDAEYPNAVVAVAVVLALGAADKYREVLWLGGAALAVTSYFMQPVAYVWLILILGLLSAALIGNRLVAVKAPPIRAAVAVVALVMLGGGATATDRSALVVSAATSATLGAISVGV